MYSLSLLTAVVVCLSGIHARTAEPPALLIAASHWQTATSLTRLPHGTPIVVLIRNSEDDYATVNARALSARNATHFAFDRDNRSLLADIFRERLTRHGAIPMELRKPRPQLPNRVNQDSDVSQTNFANLFAGQQR